MLCTLCVCVCVWIFIGFLFCLLCFSLKLWTIICRSQFHSFMWWNSCLFSISNVLSMLLDHVPRASFSAMMGEETGTGTGWRARLQGSCTRGLVHPPAVPQLESPSALFQIQARWQTFVPTSTSHGGHPWWRVWLWARSLFRSQWWVKIPGKRIWAVPHSTTTAHACYLFNTVSDFM